MFPGIFYLTTRGETRLSLYSKWRLLAGVDVEYFMMDDHQETNSRIAELLSSKGRLDKNTVQEIDSMLRRHIFIEEAILFPVQYACPLNDLPLRSNRRGDNWAQFWQIALHDHRHRDIRMRTVCSVPRGIQEGDRTLKPDGKTKPPMCESVNLK